VESRVGAMIVTMVTALYFLAGAVSAACFVVGMADPARGGLTALWAGLAVMWIALGVTRRARFRRVASSSCS